MADFPRGVRIHLDSTESVLDAAMVSRSRAGKPRVRRLYPTPTRQFNVALRGLTSSERDQVEAFLAANRKNVFGLLWPRGNVVYQVIWLDSEIRWQDLGAKLYNADLIFTLA